MFFLAPTGAQEMQMFVRPFVPNLSRTDRMTLGSLQDNSDSESIKEAFREHSEGTQKAFREKESS